MRVKIISDSTCDLSPALLERYDIAVTPLCVIKDGKDFHDGVDITPADIFAHVDGGGRERRGRGEGRSGGLRLV